MRLEFGLRSVWFGPKLHDRKKLIPLYPHYTEAKHKIMTRINVFVVSISFTMFINNQTQSLFSVRVTYCRPLLQLYFAGEGGASNFQEIKSQIWENSFLEFANLLEMHIHVFAKTSPDKRKLPLLVQVGNKKVKMSLFESHFPQAAGGGREQSLTAIKGQTHFLFLPACQNSKPPVCTCMLRRRASWEG